MKENYQKAMEEIICSFSNDAPKPSLLLHCCCAPCSSYVIECLVAHFDVSIYFYNPNIYPEEEYKKRFETLYKLYNLADYTERVKIVNSVYNQNEYYERIKGFENEREGGSRCEKCIALRMENTAKIASEQGFDFFTTTLSVSPHKNSEMINKIGSELEMKYGARFLFSDFKKKEGYKQSIILSKKYELYRQNYCGCEFSINNEQNEVK